MSFGSLELLVLFLPLVYLLHWLGPRRRGYQNGLLLGASYLFFACSTPTLLWIVLASTAADWIVLRAFDRVPAGPSRRTLLAAALLANLGTLAFFKYAGFFDLHVLVPLGLSYWTLQKVGTLLDVYHTRLEAPRSLLDFALFVSFFPQLTAGPIGRAGKLLPQLASPRSFSLDDLQAGAGQLLLGYVLKFFLAEAFAQWLVDPIFSGAVPASRLGHWAALFGYAGQIFSDFAGYSALAIGCGRLFGIELPVNFDYPYLSKSVREVWQRWHISLNTWLFDYLYGPLVTSKGWFRGRLDLGFLLVFLVSGVWHGALWTFVAWGALHGVGLIVHRRWDEAYRGLCKKDRAWVARRKTFAYRAVAWFVTQAFFVLTLIPFRAPTGEATLRFLRGLVSGTGGGTLPAVPHLFALVAVAVGAAFLVVFHLLELRRGRWLRERLFALPAPVRGVAYGLLIVFLFIFMPVASGTFIYGQF